MTAAREYANALAAMVALTPEDRASEIIRNYHYINDAMGGHAPDGGITIKEIRDGSILHMALTDAAEAVNHWRELANTVHQVAKAATDVDEPGGSGGRYLPALPDPDTLTTRALPAPPVVVRRARANADHMAADFYAIHGHYVRAYDELTDAAVRFGGLNAVQAAHQTYTLIQIAQDNHETLPFPFGAGEATS